MTLSSSVTGLASAEPSAPFPAYGSPATDALKPRPIAGVPTRVTLGQAVDIAAATSPTLDGARATLHLASSATKIAGVGLRPTVTVEGQTTTPSYPLSQFATASLQQLIYDGGAVVAEVRSAKDAEVGARDTYHRALQTLINTVAQAYFTALGAESQTALAQQIVSEYARQEQLIAAQIEAGTAAKIDLETAHSSTLQAQAIVVAAQSQEIVALAQFANAMGLDADADVRPQAENAAGETSSLPDGTPLSYDAALARALALRPDYYAAMQSVDASRESLRYARLGTWPTLSATASSELPSPQALGLSPQSGTAFTATLRIPVYDGGLTAGNADQAEAQLETALANQKSEALTVQMDVRTALSQLIAARAVLHQYDDSVALAKQVLEGREAQYRAGKPVLELFLNAQVSYGAAQNAQLSALYALREAEQAYLYALGENDLGGKTER